MSEQQLKRQIERIRKRIQEYENEEETLSVHGHWSLGYYRGKLSVMEDWLECIQEMKGGEG
ncbi:MAG: hypothetical protein J6S14_11675 [Clostridia bacterium]|nr:hypothetical protein [Clostridia bacterium]